MKKILIILLLAVAAFPAFAQMGTPIIIPLWPDGTVIIACPGGGYYYLEIEKEGTGLAPWFHYSREWKAELERWLVEW